jgi:hypothetical protein
MTELLGALAFAVMIGAQFLAVIAMHRMRQDTRASSDTFGAMRVSDHDLHVVSERPNLAAASHLATRSQLATGSRRHPTLSEPQETGL